MADEVVIEEYAQQVYKTNGEFAGAALGELITTQVVDVATLSSALNAKTKYVIVQDKGGAGFWVKPGDSTVSAAADTNGNLWVPAGQSKEFPVTPGITHIDTAADA